jgi:hypothetical protein
MQALSRRKLSLIFPKKAIKRHMLGSRLELNKHIAAKILLKCIVAGVILGQIGIRGIHPPTLNPVLLLMRLRL